ncbi:hypothetical protein N7G274_009402 [Stereocaulon virgatum]|uniref:Uncharacterized protein n=1 Tax=Stereocaulon virgatum TaxID=373712 RepID=A0ABR3ZWD2_9LECA
MNVHSTFLYGLNRSTFSLPSKILSSNQDEYRSVSRSIDTCHGRDLRSTLAERRSCPHPAPLILPRKRSIRSLAPEYTQDVQASRSSSSPPYRSVKRTKDAVLPWPSLQSADTIEDTADGPSSPLELPKTPEDRTTGRAHSASIDSDREFMSAKPLRSPIRFIPGFHAHNIAITSTIPIQTPEHKFSSVSEKSRYRYYGPTNPSDQVERFSPGCGRVPRRQLSYGDPKPWSLHRATGSQELRLKICSEADNPDSFYWSGNTAVGLNTVKAKDWYSEPMRPKPRLWLDFVDGGEPIEEAQATVVKSSPSKPREVSIPPRRTSNTTCRPSTPDSKERDASNISLAKSQEFAIGLGISAGSAIRQEKEHKCYNRIKARNDWITTPPKSTTSTPWSTRTVRHISQQTTAAISRPGTPRPPLITTPQLSELTTWILTELEKSSANNIDLQLDSPVLLQIRLPPAQRKSPRTPPTVPLRRFSTFKTQGPLSSHPPPAPPNSITSSGPCYTTPQSQSHARPSPSPPKTEATLNTLATIFPHASPSLLSTLYATYLSLHYIQSIHPSHPKTIPTHTSTNASQSSYTYNHIPSKGRVMLGLQTPLSRPPLPKCWIQPLGWQERVGKLEMQLRREVGRVVSECARFEVGGGGEGEEVLLRALGEVVRLGEGGRARE